LNPFLAWGTLALRSAEMMAASAQVIAHRTSRKNTAAQLFEMGNEKVQAAIASSHAMTRNMLGLSHRAALDPWSAWASVYSSALAPYRTRAMKNARRARKR
jgi:hypothetical protein